MSKTWDLTIQVLQHIICPLIGCFLIVELQVSQWKQAALHVTRSWPPWQVNPSLWLERISSDSYFMLFRRGTLGWWWLGSMWGNSKANGGNERNISSRLWLIEETQLGLHHLLEQQLIIYLPTGGKPCSWSKYSNLFKQATHDSEQTEVGRSQRRGRGRLIFRYGSNN